MLSLGHEVTLTYQVLERAVAVRRTVVYEVTRTNFILIIVKAGGVEVLPGLQDTDY